MRSVSSLLMASARTAGSTGTTASSGSGSASASALPSPSMSSRAAAMSRGDMRRASSAPAGLSSPDVPDARRCTGGAVDVEVDAADEDVDAEAEDGSCRSDMSELGPWGRRGGDLVCDLDRLGGGMDIMLLREGGEEEDKGGKVGVYREGRRGPSRCGCRYGWAECQVVSSQMSKEGRG